MLPNRWARFILVLKYSVVPEEQKLYTVIFVRGFM